MKLQLAGASISRKLTWLNMLVSGTALLLACLAFAGSDLVAYRQDTVRNLATEAKIIGANSISAITFGDPQSAAATLAGLGSSPQILAATIVLPNGTTFAEYRHGDNLRLTEFPALPPGESEEHWSHGTRLILAHLILFQGKPMGTVYLLADLHEVVQRAYRYVVIAGLVILLCLAAAQIITTDFRRRVAEPIVSLAETARIVSRDRNYSIRAAPAGGNDELSVLIQAFNEMLVQIQQRDQALEQARDELEQRVEERTTQLVAANKELEAFSYSVAHDLRGPLDAIGGLSYILRNTYEERLDTQGREVLDSVRQATKRMADLIDDLLNLSLATSAELKREHLDLSAMARSVAGNLRAAEAARQVEVRIADGIQADADPGLMRLVIENLLRNAWKYTSQRASAHIEFGSVEESSGTVYFVQDDGAGFDAKYADRLFRPFQRLHSQSEFPGTGVGLATVKRILERHGGEIWAEGITGRGATFYFHL